LALEERIGYRFKNVRNVEAALTHKSYANETEDAARIDNERLEFLGDAVLALVITDIAMKRFVRHDEGELSRMRATVVDEVGLGAVAESLALGQWIFLGRGEEQAGGRAKRSILADALEAIIGAVFVDGGFEAAYAMIDRLFASSLMEAGSAGAGAPRDHKTRLQEISRARFKIEPVYTVVGQTGPDHDRVYEVAVTLGDEEYGRARGRSKKEAQQSAAGQAVAALEGPPNQT
jgi:ribonuclease-3